MKNTEERNPLLTENIQGEKYSSGGMEIIKKEKTKSEKVKDSHITEAYESYKHRLEMGYKVLDNPENANMQEIEKKLEMISGNTTKLFYEFQKWMAILFCPTGIGCLFTTYYASCEKLIVPANSFALVIDSSGSYEQTKIYGPGFHILSPFHKLDKICKFGEKQYVSSELNDFHLLIVNQGDIAFFYYNGQPKLFGPGLHTFKEPMEYKEIYSLDNPYIVIGPEKWLMVPEGYAAVVINQGKVEIYKGGGLYHLGNKLINLAKIVPTIIQTDRIVKDVPAYLDHLKENKGVLPQQKKDKNNQNYYDTSYLLDTKTKDNTEVFLDAMLFWEIEDPERAATKLMSLLEVKPSETNMNEQIEMASRNIDNLREIVLRIAKARLTAQVGKMSIVDTQSLGAGLHKFGKEEEAISVSFEKKEDTEQSAILLSQSTQGYAIIQFLNEKKKELLTELNEELNEYGIKVNNVAIFDAILKPEIQKHLNQQVEAKIAQITEVVQARTKAQKEVIKAETDLQVAEQKVKTDKLNKVGTAENDLEKAKIELQTKETEGKAQAKYNEEVAKGDKNAAKFLKENPLSEQLAIFKAAKELLEGFNSGNQTTSTYVLGVNPLENIGGMFGNLANMFTKNSNDQSKIEQDKKTLEM